MGTWYLSIRAPGWLAPWKPKEAISKSWTNYLLSLLSISPEKPKSYIPNMVHRKHITVTSETFIKANQYLHKEGIIWGWKTFSLGNSAELFLSSWQRWISEQRTFSSGESGRRPLAAWALQVRLRWGTIPLQHTNWGCFWHNRWFFHATNFWGCLSLSLKTGYLWQHLVFSLHRKEPWIWKDAPGQTPPRPTLLPSAELS